MDLTCSRLRARAYSLHTVDATAPAPAVDDVLAWPPALRCAIDLELDALLASPPPNSILPDTAHPADRAPGLPLLGQGSYLPGTLPFLLASPQAGGGASLMRTIIERAMPAYRAAANAVTEGAGSAADGTAPAVTEAAEAPLRWSTRHEAFVHSDCPTDGPLVTDLRVLCESSATRLPTPGSGVSGGTGDSDLRAALDDLATFVERAVRHLGPTSAFLSGVADALAARASLAVVVTAQSMTPRDAPKGKMGCRRGTVCGVQPGDATADANDRAAHKNICSGGSLGSGTRLLPLALPLADLVSALARTDMLLRVSIAPAAPETDREVSSAARARPNDCLVLVVAADDVLIPQSATATSTGPAEGCPIGNPTSGAPSTTHWMLCHLVASADDAASRTGSGTAGSSTGSSDGSANTASAAGLVRRAVAAGLARARLWGPLALFAAHIAGARAGSRSELDEACNLPLAESGYTPSRDDAMARLALALGDVLAGAAHPPSARSAHASSPPFVSLGC